MPLIHGQQEKGHHYQNHAEGGRTGINGVSEQKEKRHSYKYRCPKTDKLPACQAEQHFGFDLGKVFGNCSYAIIVTSGKKKNAFQCGKTFFRKFSCALSAAV